MENVFFYIFFWSYKIVAYFTNYIFLTLFVITVLSTSLYLLHLHHYFFYPVEWMVSVKYVSIVDCVTVL